MMRPDFLGVLIGAAEGSHVFGSLIQWSTTVAMPGDRP